MQRLIIRGGTPQGIIDIPAAKNAILPIIAASILVQDEIVLHNITRLSDIENMLRIIRHIGGQAYFDGSDLIINCALVANGDISEELTRDIRASIFAIGAVCVRCGNVSIGYPGGCNIGKRPIDLHMDALRSMGISVVEGESRIACTLDNLQGSEIVLDYPSVGVTENIIMTAATAKGTTIIRGAAREPEIADLANFLNACGASIVGAGSDTITIEGTQELHGCDYTPISDRIIAGTYLALAAIGGGDVTVCGVSPTFLGTELDILERKGCQISKGNNCIRLIASRVLQSSNAIVTSPYPAFATDMQAQFMALETVGSGECAIIERVFDNRFNHVLELSKMGADISINGNTAIVRGVPKLIGSSVEARDLRGGAALVIAGVRAEGTTTISNIHYIDRGYYKIEDDLSSIGVDIRRIVD